MHSSVSDSSEQAAAERHASARRQRHALWLGLVLVCIWGSNFSVQKQVFAAATPGGFLFCRYLIMPACALALLLWRHRFAWPRPQPAEWLQLARLGLAGHLLHVSIVTFGIHWSTAFSSSLILACGPVFTLLILRAMRLERLSAAQVTGVAIAMAGVLVFLSEKLLGAHWQASGGDLMLLVASVFFSYYTVAAMPLIRRLGSVPVMAYGTLLGSVPVLLITAPAGMAVDWGSLSPLIWAGILWAVIVSAFVGWIAWGWINLVRGVARTAPLMYLTPPVAGFVAFLAADERFTGVKLLGAAIALAGVALAQFSGRGPAGR